MNPILHTILMVLGCLALLALSAVWFCMFIARRMLHPISKRKPLTIWPDQYGIPYENVTFETEDRVQLKGWFLTSPEESNKTIILMHGWDMNRSDILKNTYFLRDLGFNLLYFDFRALGESGGKTSSIGYLELRDISAAVKFLKETRAPFCEKIGLYGLSVGGMVAINEAACNPEIACVVTEASYYSFRRIASRWAWERYRIPYLPLVPIIMHYIRKYLGDNPERYSPKYNVAKIAPRPVFIIHGRKDKVIPSVHARWLYKRAGNPKSIWVLPGAQYNKCAETGGYEYKQRVADFFRQYM